MDAKVAIVFTPSSPEPSDESGLPIWVIVLIIVGALLLCVALACVGWRMLPDAEMSMRYGGDSGRDFGGTHVKMTEDNVL